MKHLAINLLATVIGMAIAITTFSYIILPIINGA